MTAADLLRMFLDGGCPLMSDDPRCNEVQIKLVRLADENEEARECLRLLVEFFEGNP